MIILDLHPGNTYLIIEQRCKLGMVSPNCDEKGNHCAGFGAVQLPARVCETFGFEAVPFAPMSDDVLR